MTLERKVVRSGGCQCGAVRYVLYAEPTNPHICHCRMCQKALGSFFAPLAVVPLSDITWTRGAPSTFMSSSVVERGFCKDCGTPLTFRFIERGDIDVTIGSLDDPASLQPLKQCGLESRMPWLAALEALPGGATSDMVSPDLFARIESYQHPDHDTDHWEPKS